MALSSSVLSSLCLSKAEKFFLRFYSNNPECDIFMVVRYHRRSLNGLNSCVEEDYAVSAIQLLEKAVSHQCTLGPDATSKKPLLNPISRSFVNVSGVTNSTIGK